jgi:hypothetical protein
MATFLSYSVTVGCAVLKVGQHLHSSEIHSDIFSVDIRLISCDKNNRNVKLITSPFRKKTKVNSITTIPVNLRGGLLITEDNLIPWHTYGKVKVKLSLCFN